MSKGVAEVLTSLGELRVLIFRLDSLHKGDPEVMRQNFDNDPQMIESLLRAVVAQVYGTFVLLCELYKR